MKRRTMSPSMVVACVALLVALGGTGVAAVGGFPKGSVTTSAIRDSAVTTRKLATKAVTLAKLGPSARIPGPRGGVGPKGDPGPKGDKGDIGPSDAYVDTNEGPVTIPVGNGNLRVATVRLPSAGSYVIWAKANLDAPSSDAKVPGAFCDLVAGAAGGPADDSLAVNVSPGRVESVSGFVAVEVTGATSVNLNCGALLDAMTVGHIKLVAIKVGKLTASTG